MSRLSNIATIIVLAWFVILTIAEYVIAEHNSLTTAIAYIPQHLFLLPFLIAFLLSIVAKYRAQTVLNAVMIVLFGVFFMGFNFGIPSDRRGDLRVMTLNLAGKSVASDQLLKTINEQTPDVLYLQEVKMAERNQNLLHQLVKKHYCGTWYSARAGDVAIISRFPLHDVRAVSIMPSSKRRALIACISKESQQVTLANVHFATNVAGASKRHPICYLGGCAKSRTTQVRNLLSIIPPDNVIIGGDFNLPPRGIAYRRLTWGYTDCFKAGGGFGYTYRSDLPLDRIDHILVGNNLTPVSWHVIGKTPSDHRAVVVDLFVAR